MKRLGIIALAFALVLGLSQCKKENTTSTSDEGTKVPVTLNVSSSNGSRVAVEGSTGVVTFENGDVIYVASNGTCVGTLTYNGTQFAGEVTEPTEGQKLHFYFLGNKTPEFNADNTGCSVVISDQTEYLPVISYAPSRENYETGRTAYNATLLNKCALVKFYVTTSSEMATCIAGMNNKVAVDFSTNEFVYGQEGEGIVTLAAGNGNKWAILLPQNELTEAIAFSDDGIYTGICGTIPTIAENDYLYFGGIEVRVTTEVNPGEVPTGAISGKFTINDNGDQVYFSQGNLQYIGSANTPYWKFAENQWDYLGTTTSQNSANQNVDRDLFGWGTSGWNNGNLYYRPYDTEYLNDFNYGYGYGPTDGTNYCYDLTEAYANADWGFYNPIANGGNVPNQWRTLTLSEWNYVLYNRITPSGIRYAKAMVNGLNGIVLLPDDWRASVFALTETNLGFAVYTTNEITTDVWAIMEANGAVFLPAAGERSETSVSNVGSKGLYWSSTYCITNYAYMMNFGSNNLGTDYIFRDSGCSVRLVRDVE